MKYLLHLFLACCAASAVAQSNPDSWVYWGENNTFSSNSRPLIGIGTGAAPSIGNVDNNFWTEGSGGLDPLTSTGIFFSMSLPTLATYSSSLFTFSGIDCSPYSSTIKINSKPLSVNKSTLSTDTCADLKQWMDFSPVTHAEYKEKYDSLRAFVEHCANIDTTVCTAFEIMDGTVNAYDPEDTMRFINYRNWLISVLYLNKTYPPYFCSCLLSIAGTYQYGKYNPTASYLAVLDFIRHIPSCYGKGLDKEYTKDSLYLHQQYTDTSIPSLDSLGLGFLLDKQGIPSMNQTLSQTYLASFTSSPNPFKGETMLGFTLNRMSYITLAIYDELGRLVWGDGRGSSLEAGTHTIQIDGSKLPSGTLYARIATGFGEVKTVKLVHEK